MLSECSISNLENQHTPSQQLCALFSASTIHQYITLALFLVPGKKTPTFSILFCQSNWVRKKLSNCFRKCVDQMQQTRGLHRWSTHHSSCGLAPSPALVQRTLYALKKPMKLGTELFERETAVCAPAQSLSPLAPADETHR